MELIFFSFVSITIALLWPAFSEEKRVQVLTSILKPRRKNNWKQKLPPSLALHHNQ